VGSLLCTIVPILSWLVWAYTIVLLVYAVLSWIPDLRGGRIAYFVASLVEPVLVPLRRVIPPLGGLDLSFLIVLLVLQLFVRPELTRLAFSCAVGL
jgi:YggT family protein